MKSKAASKKRFLGYMLLCTGIIVCSAGCSYNPVFTPADIESAAVISETRRSIVITPSFPGGSTSGLLFYPGGLVDCHVYNEVLSEFTERTGIKTVIVKMPANLAVLDINAGLSVIGQHPDITRWIIAGHSLGGAMAASTVSSNPDVYSGLIFMDSYPADGDSLKAWPGAVLSLYSSIEKIRDIERMQKTLGLIPEAVWLTSSDRVYPADKINYSVIHQIDGGSHSYFGTYGPQDGDYPPTITRDEFHDEVVDYMDQFFTENGWK